MYDKKINYCIRMYVYRQQILIISWEEKVDEVLNILN
jgi:hypothetical protein